MDGNGEVQGHVACRVFQDARPVLQTYTLRKRREVFDEINALLPPRPESS